MGTNAAVEDLVRVPVVGLAAGALRIQAALIARHRDAQRGLGVDLAGGRDRRRVLLVGHGGGVGGLAGGLRRVLGGGRGRGGGVGGGLRLLGAGLAGRFGGGGGRRSRSLGDRGGAGIPGRCGGGGGRLRGRGRAFGRGGSGAGVAGGGGGLGGSRVARAPIVVVIVPAADEGEAGYTNAGFGAGSQHGAA